MNSDINDQMAALTGIFYFYMKVIKFLFIGLLQFLVKHGVYDFWNWFDDRTWYPHIQQLNTLLIVADKKVYDFISFLISIKLIELSVNDCLKGILLDA